MISTLIALPYELARTPFVMLDNSLSDRLPESSVPRVTLDRAIGSADRIAGTILRNPDIAQRGAERIERSEKLTTAARLEQQAEVRRKQAEETLDRGRKEAAAQRKAAEDHVDEGLAEADRAEARGKREATARATQTAAAKKATAAKKAANRTAVVERRKATVSSAAEAKKKAAQRTTRAKLDEANENKRAADAARSDAERLSDLTEAKKQERKQG